ncbi:very-long-chain 3-oxoacyl-CoA reductase-like [Daktulosphaira vitifoliae]|uniref:very-long-chain 3-oxoacyl-CoA reductase-like n=1 Tax=Daktulosphaira vitifoliae TaxID=58002 RepID=UPI0021AA45FA|nr:very-long-chain 3-oxoacyl-CoA reductase-like [Daktulosphaira vitifoliae]
MDLMFWSSDRSFLEIVGVAGLCIFFLKIFYLGLKFSYEHLIAPIIGLTVNFQKAGKWAVITGATHGVGREYAEQLAAKGLNIVLISRSRARLEDTSNGIRTKYKVETKIIEVDFYDENPELTDKIVRELSDLDVGVLVNNVGLHNPYPDYFLNFDQNNPLYENMIKLNVTPLVYLCRAIMPGMKKRRRGIVINISSAEAVISSPLLAVYGATKAFIEKFSNELTIEHKNDGIIVQCVIPYSIATESLSNRNSWMVPSPKVYVHSALKTTGIQSLTTGYLPHTIFVNIVQYLDSICHPLISLLRLMTLLRKRANFLKGNSKTSTV